VVGQLYRAPLLTSLWQRHAEAPPVGARGDSHLALKVLAQDARTAESNRVSDYCSQRPATRAYESAESSRANR